MSDLKEITFMFHGTGIRVLTGLGDRIFVSATDVATALRYKKQVKAIKRYCSGLSVNYHVMNPLDSNPNTLFILEIDVINLAANAKNQGVAYRFRNWIAASVFPVLEQNSTNT